MLGLQRGGGLCRVAKKFLGCERRHQRGEVGKSGGVGGVVGSFAVEKGRFLISTAPRAHEGRGMSGTSTSSSAFIAAPGFAIRWGPIRSGGDLKKAERRVDTRLREALSGVGHGGADDLSKSSLSENVDGPGGCAGQAGQVPALPDDVPGSRSPRGQDGDGGGDGGCGRSQVTPRDRPRPARAIVVAG